MIRVDSPFAQSRAKAGICDEAQVFTNVPGLLIEGQDLNLRRAKARYRS